MLTGNQAFAQTHAVNQSNFRVFDTTLAAVLGLKEAIFINRLQFWISQGYGILHEGKRWIYNTYEQWIQNELAGVSRDQLKRMTKNLRELGILSVKKLKAHQWWQTNFYTVNEETLQNVVEEFLRQSGKAETTTTDASGAKAISIGDNPSDDLYTFKTTVKTEREGANSVSQDSLETDHKEEPVEASSNGKPQEDNASTADSVENSPDSGDDPSSEPIETNLQLEPFHKELLRILQFCDGINNPWAYAQKCVDNLRAGSPSSVELYEKWLESGEIVVEDIIGEQKPKASEKGKNPSSVKPNQEGGTQQGDQPKNEGKVNEELREWQIQPTDTHLIEAGYSVGDIYPEFVQWATPRLKYHPDLTEYAAKSHAIYKLKHEPQLTLEMWRDFKRLLIRELEDKKTNESKGLPYFTPPWMQLPADVPVSEARKASVELNEVKAKEQQAMEANRNDNAALTAGEAEKREKAMELETSYSGEAVVSEGEEAVVSEEEKEEVSELIEDEKAMESETSCFEEVVPSVPSEEEEEEVLEPVEKVKNAIALLEKDPLNPIAEELATHLISTARGKASESELEEINQLIDSSGLDIW